MKKIRILYICGGPLDHGGITTWVYNYLSHMDKERFCVDIVCYGNEVGSREELFCSDGTKVYHVPYLGKNPLKNYWGIKSIIKNGKYDIVHSHLEAMNAYSLYIAKSCGIQVRISHAHGSDYFGGNWAKLKIHGFLKKRIHRYSTVRLACSAAAGKWLYGDSAFEIIPNAIDLDKYAFNSNDRVELRKQLSIPVDARIVGCVGHFNSIKNQKYLIEVFNEICSNSLECNAGNMYILFVGDGELLDYCQELGEKLGISSRLRFTGRVDDVNRFYSAMDVLAMPSIKEGLPLVAVEAQANGLSCLLSEGVPREAKVNEHTVFLPFEIDKWKKAILEMFMEGDNSRNRGSDINMFVANEYNIDYSSRVLSKIYERSIKSD
ncbi:glycosyltransferase [Butyrivibrio fibrisolvens]|uniref:glycosyltransferase n=1 Tax=Butyrivibrio fibrisolvens TaxID=831 RepID=UPI0018AD51CB|nr:glycosyltransferase [Butyrivibrio fibrisolvens]